MAPLAEPSLTSPTPTDPTEAAGRRRIMDEAATLFLQQGFDGTSLRHIADAAGMKAGSLYYHFSSKNDLLEAILRRGLQVMVDAFEAANDATSGAEGRTRIEAHIRAHLAALYENGPYTAAHVTTFRTAPEPVCEAIVPARDAYEARWTALLEELVATGELAPDIAIGLTRLTLFGAMNTSIEWFDVERGTLDELSAVIARQFWTGLSTRETP